MSCFLLKIHGEVIAELCNDEIMDVYFEISTDLLEFYIIDYIVT